VEREGKEEKNSIVVLCGWVALTRSRRESGREKGINKLRVVRKRLDY